MYGLVEKALQDVVLEDTYGALNLGATVCMLVPGAEWVGHGKQGQVWQPAHRGVGRGRELKSGIQLLTHVHAFRIRTRRV